ncbi:60S ribosomal export protein NMD3 [Vairimorpha necatrix]|uniref:60S ribosomal export protein NMD3 n=1 Tax=Vairimorpha necatrix TaxID=6039 RepID=A0AAX4JGU4_9MICR
MILCYKCGIPTDPSEHNLCTRCTTMFITVSEKLKRSINVDWCKGCERYLNKPRTWSKYEWGSRDLLIYLIKSNPSPNHFDILDSNFNYTEEHSKRMSLQVVLESNGIREECEIRYTIRNKQCPDCEKIEAKQHWKAVVQVRHRMEHPRIFILLEQLIIKNKMYSETTNIKMRKGGIDFYFTDRTFAYKLVNFIENVLPVKIILSERLISKDIQNSKSNYKFSFSVEIAPLCVDDFVILDREFSNSLGIGNMALVKKVSTHIILLDPFLIKEVKVSSNSFWSNKDKFKVLISSKNLVKFNLLEIDQKPILKNESYILNSVSVTKLDDTNIIETKSHLGKITKEDDIVLGYDLNSFNSSIEATDLPDILIVRKEPRRDIKWKSPVTSEEYYYFLDDVKKDKEIVNNLCEMEEENKDLIEDLENLKSY